MNEELIFWIALSQIRKWGNEKVNKLIIRIIQENSSKLSDFFAADKSALMQMYHLDENEISDMESVKKEIPAYSFLVEDLLAQGFEIITINSPKYPKTMKDNLKIKHSPPVIYVKGNTQILQENSVAVVGSRDADEKSLIFTDNIAKSASKQFKVIVSGFAKGVDKQALDSALKYKGQSIIVLPQGIMTFGSGINKYYKVIQTGDVLVLSTFFPKVPWSAQLAMARNPIIYGLAKEIYVAQSSDKGGTWSGVIDGLRKGREIFVRMPESDETNSNAMLIEKGAIPVDIDGNVIQNSALAENMNIIPQNELIDEKILQVLKNAELTSFDILKSLNLDWNPNKMTLHLKNMLNIKISDKKPYKYSLLESKFQESLFGD